MFKSRLILHTIVVITLLFPMSATGNDESMNTHLCYFLNHEMKDLYIPIAAVFAFPSLKTLLILDHFNMYYQVEGDDAILLSSGSGLKINLTNARYGQVSSRWPSLNLSELPSGMDNDAIVHNGVPYICYYKTDPFNSQISGKCYSLKSAEELDFTSAMLNESTSGDFADKFIRLEKCRRKGSLKSNGDFVMTFVSKVTSVTDDTGKKKKKRNNKQATTQVPTTPDPNLECPIEWRTTPECPALLLKYNGLVLILNLFNAYAFHAAEMVPGGSASVYRIPLKKLFECDPSFKPRSSVLVFGLTIKSLLIIAVGGFFAIVLLLEFAYILGLLECWCPSTTKLRQNPTNQEHHPKAASSKKRRNKKPQSPPSDKSVEAASIESTQELDTAGNSQEVDPNEVDQIPDSSEMPNTSLIEDTSTGFDRSKSTEYYQAGYYAPPPPPAPSTAQSHDAGHGQPSGYGFDPRLGGHPSAGPPLQASPPNGYHHQQPPQNPGLYYGGPQNPNPSGYAFQQNSPGPGGYPLSGYPIQALGPPQPTQLNQQYPRPQMQQAAYNNPNQPHLNELYNPNLFNWNQYNYNNSGNPY